MQHICVKAQPAQDNKVLPFLCVYLNLLSLTCSYEMWPAWRNKV